MLILFEGVNFLVRLQNDIELSYLTLKFNDLNLKYKIDQKK